MTKAQFDEVFSRVVLLADTWRHENSAETYPAERLTALQDAGAIEAFTVLANGRDVDDLRSVLRLIGAADLSLGRLFEGHVNAAQLVQAFGTAAQREKLRSDLANGRIFGVWNTEPTPGVSIEHIGEQWRLHGSKSFATGAGHIDRALITARRSDGGKQLVLVDIGDEASRADNSGWHVRGMRGTQSGLFDFTAMLVGEIALIGQPGDYEREPRFSAGAWRFTAVQLGAIEALVRLWREQLRTTNKAADPIQRARFGAAVSATRSAGLWVAQASRLAEASDPRAVAHVLMTRGVVEEAGLLVMEGAARAIGTASFFADSRIDRITRDLGLYLRQPAPDQARDRAALAWLEEDCWGEDAWW